MYQNFEIKTTRTSKEKAKAEIAKMKEKNHSKFL
jgi:hypothetical protein